MEYLHTTLSDCLEKYGVLPENISYEILRDVALGLRYLHEQSPPVIHRDLSANNILLASDMSAKISDLGVAKIVNLTSAQITQRITTQTPGCPCYMPPESLIAKPSYTSKIDNYSYGVLMIHVLCGKWPFPGDSFRTDPQNPTSYLPVSEFERRAEYLQDIGQDHPLVGLIRQCLSNAPPSRPEASEILHQIEVVISQNPPSFTNKIEMLQQTQPRGNSKGIQVLGSESESKTDKNADSLVRENDTLRREIENQRSEVESQRRQLESQRREISIQRQQIELKRGECESQWTEIRSLRERNESQRREILFLMEQFERLSIPISTPSTVAPLATPTVAVSNNVVY